MRRIVSGSFYENETELDEIAKDSDLYEAERLIWLFTLGVRLTLETDESYNLYVSNERNKIEVFIHAATFFGARHALETLSQLIAYRFVRTSIRY